MVGVENGPLFRMDLDGVCEAVVATFLRTHGYTDTLAAFEREGGRTSASSSCAYEQVPRDLRTLVELAASHAMTQSMQHATLEEAPASALVEAASPVDYVLAATYDHLHTSNILSVTPATYPGVEGPCVATTGADRRVVFVDVSSGDVVGILEPSMPGHPRRMGHEAAVLDLSQHPQHPTYVLTAGMDGRVVQWDLRHDRPVHELRDHSRFVVRVLHSDDGRFMATAGYDKRIHLYAVEVHNEPPVYTHMHTLALATNPEALVFVRGPATPCEAPWEQDERTWLVYTARDRATLHYVALPTSCIGGTPDWTVLEYGTNADPNDPHTSYSLLHLTLHPSGRYVAAQTGELGTSDRLDGPSPTLPRILLMPLFSARRHATLWTSAPVSAFASPRHAWMPRGDAVWVTGEDGVLRLVALDGTERASVRCHGGMAEPASGRAGAALAAAAWRSGGNTVIKGVAVLADHRVASCGFDRTVRILRSL
ncbi:hypothetical protein MEQU1_000795 [Malassezia equina]|uniref:Uncharacterized protein n=1 Tax=Malassezia equina TaxID=1381935 RepID=A0AAF0IZ56_9BASI|nr:hypothetical protein MEQU1_000795 [Malassezia equina]